MAEKTRLHKGRLTISFHLLLLLSIVISVKALSILITNPPSELILNNIRSGD